MTPARPRTLGAILCLPAPCCFSAVQTAERLPPAGFNWSFGCQGSPRPKRATESQGLKGFALPYTYSIAYFARNVND